MSAEKFHPLRCSGTLKLLMCLDIPIYTEYEQNTTENVGTETCIVRVDYGFFHTFIYKGFSSALSNHV